MRKYLRITIIGILLIAQGWAGKTPQQLNQVIDHFMKMQSSSLEISQVIDWRFMGKNDSITLKMDIKADRNFHLTLDAFGMEIFVTENEMMTINHVRQQIIYENASPDELLKQLFVGGDLSDARFKREEITGNGLKRLDFRFSGDFSDWESLSVVLDANDDLKQIILVDYDGNKYLITLNYLKNYHDFVLPNIQKDFLHYQTADLRD
ncbi:MAG: hypothetical protein U9Q77_03825 [Candidatus Marinimicrobia bacterium]|nr:hypothetical protein [Candidatus Neomarinimicrobiota bacterium]